MNFLNKPKLFTLLLAGGLVAAQAQQPSIPERVAAVKATMAVSKVVLQRYEWIETTVVSLKGDEKSRKQERCYYGADGGITKVPLAGAPDPEKKRRGIRGRIVEKKKEELTDYMKSAIALVKTYVPLDPVKIEKAKDAGKVALEVLEPSKRARLTFRDYEKAGDNIALEVDLASNRILGLKVATYLEDAKDAVTLDVRMGQLNDGTTYPNTVALVAKAKKLTVTVDHSGYRKTGN